MLNVTFILKTNNAVTKEQYEHLVEAVSDFSKNYDLYLDDVLEQMKYGNISIKKGKGGKK